MRLRPLALAGALAAAGCTAPLVNQPAQLPRTNHYEAERITHRAAHKPVEMELELDWRKQLLEPEFLEWQPREQSRPTVDEVGRVYVATRDGYVRCIDSEGEVIWEYKTKGPFYGGLTLDGDKLFVPTADGALLALDSRNGQLKWAFRAGEELGSQPVVANSLVYVTSFANTVFAVDEETGAWKWQYRRDSVGEFTIRGASMPAVDVDKLFVGFADGAAVCLDALDGTMKWNRPLSHAPQFPDADADPQVDTQGHVYFASYASGLFSLDEESGQIIWAQSVPGITSLLLVDDTLYSASATLISARTTEDGLERWHHKVASGYPLAPTSAGPYLFVPTTEQLMVFDRKTGQPHRPFNPGRGISAPPGVGRGEVYVLSNWGFLYALIPQKLESR